MLPNMATVVVASWRNAESASPKSYLCGYCGDKVGPDKAFLGTSGSSIIAQIYLCSSCRQPTYFDPAGSQWPGAAFGSQVGALPPEVEIIYGEVRRCMAASAWNTAVMACRKLLMHVAAERGAEDDKSFKYYVDWLVTNHYVPPGGDVWVGQIRERGNEANHEIQLMDQHIAEQIVSFTEMLLKFVYEFPARAAAPSGAS